MNGNNYMKWLHHILNAVALWPVTGQCFQNTEWRAILYIPSKFHKSNKPANLNYHMSIKKVKRSRIQVWAFALRWAQKTKPCFVTLRTFFTPTAAQSGIFLPLHERLRPVQDSQQEFAQGVKIPRPFAFLPGRHMAICGKISGHKQFNVASAISNFKKILSKNISPFGRVKTESENICICWRRLYKKQ